MCVLVCTSREEGIYSSIDEVWSGLAVRNIQCIPISWTCELVQCFDSKADYHTFSIQFECSLPLLFHYSGMHSVYTFGPTFRAEKSHTRRHLSEFYMVEAETVAMEAADMQELLNLIERMYKSTVETILRQCSADVKLFHEQIARPETKVSSVLLPPTRPI